MALSDDVFLITVGVFAEMKKKIEDLINQGKISQQEAQRLFDNLNEDQLKNKHLSPLALSVGFSVYINRKIYDLLSDLQQKGKISSEEAKKYYQKYVPDEFRHRFVREKYEKKSDFVQSSDFDKIVEKLEVIDKLISEKKI
ncbi:MAG TPA: hypothetical protein PK466_00390 [Thermotogota bacterium]|mgnify:CR=1 FL=1|nr:hypothetical protein [Thermotogota bacterium]HPJ87551.1 hypothetical protein [Thermotogota bacterium]HPR94756.1 hypothetical protein [Thermotogota bacterium]